MSTQRSDGQIMRPSLSSIILVVVVRRRVRPCTISNRSREGAETRSTVIPNIWSSYAGTKGFMPDYRYLSPTTGNPAWPSIVLLLGVPALVMDPEMGLWPKAGSTNKRWTQIGYDRRRKATTLDHSNHSFCSPA